MAAADAGRALFINDVAERRISADGNLSLEQVEALPCVAAGHSAQDRMSAGAARRAGGYRIAV